jgi:predicted DNA-binding transcriptional regulator YafY
VKEVSVGSTEWLVGEIFSHRGEAVVLEPQDLRSLVAARAEELAGLLVRPAARA